MYASEIYTPRAKYKPNVLPFFYLGSDNSTEFVEFCESRNLWAQAVSIGPNPRRYAVFPAYLHHSVHRWGVEIIPMSQFDLRICSRGGGIPSVATYQQSLLEA